MRRVLVVASPTSTNDELLKVIKERNAQQDCSFSLLVLAIAGKGSMMMGMLSASVNIPTSSGGDGVNEYEVAEHRLNAAMDAMRKAGVHLDGTVGDPDPMKAIGAYLKYREFDEIIVLAVDRSVSRWLHQDLPHKLTRKFHLPVSTTTART
jgi:hypothetical protein